MEIRPAASGDQAGVRALAAAYSNFEDWPTRPDYLDHALAAGRLLVAVDGSGVAGFATVLLRAGVAHLGDLFVDPRRKGQGIGSALLAQAWEGARERTTVASGDERALPLYARHGMLAIAPVLYLAGTGARVAAGPPARLAPPGELAALDAQVCGRARPEEHAFLARHPAAAAYRVGDAGYGWIRTEATAAYLGPCGCLRGGDAAAVVCALVARAGADGRPVHLPVPGWHPVLARLLAAGFRIEARDTFMASRIDLVDLARYVPSADLG